MTITQHAPLDCPKSSTASRQRAQSRERYTWADVCKPPIYIINIAEQRDRWAMMERECQRSGLQATRFNALNGRGLSPDELARLYSPELNAATYHRPLTPGEIGCYASHIAIWHRLLASDAPFCTVFEDDIQLHEDLPTVVDQFLKVDLAWDMIKLMGRKTEKVRSWLALDGHHTLIQYARVPSFTSAYAISRSGARKLLNTRLPFARPIDVDLRHWWESDATILGVQPYPVELAPCSEISSTQPRRADTSATERTKKLTQQLLYTFNNWLHSRQHVTLGEDPSPH